MMISFEDSAMVCDGLDGRDPQHFLAALGLHKIVAAIVDSKGDRSGRTTLSWFKNGDAWNPVISDLGSEVSISEIVNFLHFFAKDEYEALIEARSNSKEDSQGQKPVVCQNLEEELKINEKFSNIFRFGDIIGVEASKFKESVSVAQSEFFSGTGFSRILSDELSGLGSEIVGVKKTTEEKKEGDEKKTKVEKTFVAPTFFSFSNGNSGKCLLKDVRNCMAWVDSENLAATLEGDSDKACVKKDARYPKKASFPTPLNWSPASLVSHALARNDPAKAMSISFPARESLAFWGLGQFTCFPTAGGLNISGIQKNKSEKYFFWPIWGKPLSIREVFWLLSQFNPYSSKEMKLKGVYAEFQVMALNPNGKRYYFSTSSLPDLTA